MFDTPDFAQHEQVVFFSDAHSGLRMIIAIHNTARGPAIGGFRMWPYTSAAAATADVLRLSIGMSYKAAMAQLPCGGGKSVVIGDPARDKSRELLLAVGRAVDSLGGRYTISDDVGTTVRDLEVVRSVTPYVAGPMNEAGESSPATAYGVFQGILATAAHGLEREDLSGVSVAVQGLGAVGYRLCGYLAQRNAKLIVSDLRAELTARAAAEFGAQVLPPEDILFAEVDILAPCALGGILNDATLGRLRCKTVAGGANNQLKEPRHGRALHARGITYVPDYVLNVGGLIDLVHEQRGDYAVTAVLRDCERIRQTTLEVLDRARQEGQPPSEVADRIAEERFSRTSTRFDVTAATAKDAE